jgi:pimeloyl-ACP methyl ester carboxylesterase
MASDDDIVLMQHTVEMYQAIATAQLAIVPGTSHLLLFEKPTLCTGLVAAFLSSDPAPDHAGPVPWYNGGCAAY